MIFLEKKGIIQMILLLLNNQDFSKYEIEKQLHLSNHTINSCLMLLEEKGIINISKNIGPRNKYKIELTELGFLIAQKLQEIESINWSPDKFKLKP
ncbi:MAG: hypothetical protein ACTSV5_04000 [Promethearchaeota archaeon]